MIAGRLAGVLVFVSAKVVSAGVYTYECDSLPPEDGWTLLQAFCDPEEWVADGSLVQEVLMCDEYPGEGQQFDYQHVIDESVAGPWFAEWRMMTTGISDELYWTAPASLVVHNGSGTLYHFTIADDQVRFIRTLPQNPVLWFDIAPGVFHTFRVELLGEKLDAWYGVWIDGALVDAGIPEGPLFPAYTQAAVNIRAKAKLVPSVTTWDYLRWGPIPDDFDFNGDGVVGFDDLYFFQECLSDPQGAGSWVGCAWADPDASGLVDCSDFAAFVAAWTDPADPPSVPQCDCPADLNESRVVNASDLALLLGAWGPNPTQPADLNNDGVINASDLALLLGAWGPCP